MKEGYKKVTKEDLFSKLNIKDYRSKLENVLENKLFTEDTKNILLNILYKIETAYEDYSRVKVYVPLKKDFLEEIINVIEKNCNEIEIIKPKLNGETKLGNKKYIVESKNNKIISYSNEKSVFYALNRLNSNLLIPNLKFPIFETPMKIMLNKGYIMNKEEIIRDFDGWTWNIVSNEIENYLYNIVYQNITILLGHEFMQNFINNKNMNFINEFENKIEERFANDKECDISKFIYQVTMLEYLKENEIEKDNVLKAKLSLEQELNQLNNKKEYLQSIANSKKIIGKDIKEIDKKMNNNKLLRDSFKEENEKLEKSEQFFSLSGYSEVLQEKREKLLKKLDYYSELMKPMNFVKKKDEISNKYKILNEINFDADYKSEIKRLLIALQKEFLKLFNRKIIDTQSRKEILQIIYLFRYYKLIYINKNKQIKDIKELEENISETEKLLITKACELKTLNILSKNIEENYKLVSNILSYNIIEIEAINLEFKKSDKNVIITIYDDETMEDTIIYDANEELNVKFNKKIKLFN